MFLIADHRRDYRIAGGHASPAQGPAAPGERSAVHRQPPHFVFGPRAGGKTCGHPVRVAAPSPEPYQGEERLDEILRRSGEVELLRLRDEAREAARQLALPEEFQRLDSLIGTLLGTRNVPLASPVGIARAPPAAPTIPNGWTCSSVSSPNLRRRLR